MVKDAVRSFRLNKEQLRELKKIADKKDLSMAQIIRRLIKEYIENEQSK